jgi:hypothetical protein
MTWLPLAKLFHAHGAMPLTVLRPVTPFELMSALHVMLGVGRVYLPSTSF